MKNIVTILCIFYFTIISSYVSAKDYCPEKILDTVVVEGKYVGIECEDMCYATISLDNSEQFTFLCGEDEANKFLGSPGSRVKVTVNIEQFWNEYGNECSRVEVFNSAEIIAPESTSNNFDYDQCIDKSGGVTVEMINCMQTSISILNKKIAFDMKKNFSLCNDNACKESLAKAHQAWELYIKEMSHYILISNDENSSASRMMAQSFIREEMLTFSELIAPQEF